MLQVDDWVSQNPFGCSFSALDLYHRPSVLEVAAHRGKVKVLAESSRESRLFSGEEPDSGGRRSQCQSVTSESIIIS